MSNETRICNDKMQKNDNSCVNVQKHTRIPSMNALAMFVSQIFVVVLLAIAAILPIATAKITLILCLIIMLTFIALWPLHGNVIDRAIALCAGIASTWFATGVLKGWLPKSVIIDNETVSMSKFIAAIHPYERWAVSFALILAAATFVTFLRQMLRENRTNLVRNLSHTLTASIACAALPGWLFLPSIISFMPSLRNLNGGILVIVLCIFMLIALSGLSYLWVRNNYEEYETGIVSHDIAISILPIMFSGMLVYLAGLGMLVAA